MKRLHCKKCDFTTSSLPNIAAHYRKKHPSAMKRKSKPVMRVKSRAPVVQDMYCRYCGRANH